MDHVEGRRKGRGRKKEEEETPRQPDDLPNETSGRRMAVGTPELLLLTLQFKAKCSDDGGAGK